MGKMQVLQYFSVFIILSMFALLGLYAIKFTKYEAYYDMESSIVFETKSIEHSINKKIGVFASVVIPNEDINLKEFKVEDDTCNGYVILKNYLFINKYKAYIKCNNYETKGYKENH